MKSVSRDILKKICRRLGLPLQTSWSEAQDFELHHAIDYMQGEIFQRKLLEANSEEFSISNGHVNPGILVEYFSNDIEEWKKFTDHISGKSVLEIGPSVASVLCQWDIASKRIVIDPLFDSVIKYQEQKFGKTGFKNVSGHSLPAEQEIPNLVGSIDGAVFIRNCLDHSPAWPFILNNITNYMKPGAILLLWTDLIHPEHYLNGHYDITDDLGAFRSLVTNLGFSIITEYQNEDSDCLNYGCKAIRV